MFERSGAGLTTFVLHQCCANCNANSSRRVPVPIEDDAPRTVEEFLESAALLNLGFNCQRCDSSIAALVGVTVEPQMVDAA